MIHRLRTIFQRLCKDLIFSTAVMSIIELAYVLFMYLSVNDLPGLHTYLND